MTKSRATADGYESDTEFPYTISKAPKKANQGGISIENQGRVVKNKTTAHSFNAEPPSLKGTKWTYTVAVTKSVYDARDNQRTIDDYLTIAPTDEAERLALLIGNNEQITLSDGSDSELDQATRQHRRTRKNKNKNLSKLDAHDVSVHIQYSAWQANWVTRHQRTPATIEQVRNEYQALKEKNPKRASHLKRYEKQRSYYPFGAMRSLLFNHAESKEFLETMARRVPAKDTILPPLFILIQDADYCDLNPMPMFYAPVQAALADEPEYEFVKTTFNEMTALEESSTLLDRYDTLIAEHHEEHRRYPRFYGGAHVYSTDEDMNHLAQDKKWKGVNIESSKYWTRFGSELGNAMKHLIGLHNPYSLYFHEPNTLMLWPGKAGDINFGDKSEMEEYFRRELENVAVNAKPYAKFHGGVVVATSQRRSQSPFTVKFFGTFENNQFKNWGDEDLRALQNMAQEILRSIDWANAVCTAFNAVRIKKKANADVQLLKDRWSMKNCDGRALIARLYNLYDPHFLAYLYDAKLKTTLSWEKFFAQDQNAFLENLQRPSRATADSPKREGVTVCYASSSLAHVLIDEHYQSLIPTTNNLVLREIKILLTHLYNDEACQKIIALARNTGELRRMMFNSVLAFEPPAQTSALKLKR